MTQSQEALYSIERDWLLGQAATLSQRSFELPADGLEEVIRSLGYSLRSSWSVPAQVMAYTDFDRKHVVLAFDFAQRLDYPDSAPGVRLSCLAHEIGHIRLHAERALEGVFRKSWEREANEFAMVFLMPRERVLSRPEVWALQSGEAQAQEELWGLVAELALAFKVTPSFMARSLVAYEVIKMNRTTRKIRPVLRLMRVYRSLAA
jgi:hypothetical protein